MVKEEELYLRKAQLKDLDTYYEWANDPVVRKNAINQEEISYENHVNWFNKKLQDSNCYMYLGFCNNNPCGQIRFDIDEDKNEAAIDFSLDKAYRGKGLGKAILEQGTQQFLKETQGKFRVIGLVKQENVASQKAFLKSGFSESQSEREGYKMYAINS